MALYRTSLRCGSPTTASNPATPRPSRPLAVEVAGGPDDLLALRQPAAHSGRRAVLGVQRSVDLHRHGSSHAPPTGSLTPPSQTLSSKRQSLRHGPRYTPDQAVGLAVSPVATNNFAGY